MPVAYVKKLAKEYDMSVEDVEDIWEKSKEIVDKTYPELDKESDQYWALVSSITLQIVKAKSEKQKKAHESKIVPKYRFVFKE